MAAVGLTPFATKSLESDTGKPPQQITCTTTQSVQENLHVKTSDGSFDSVSVISTVTTTIER